MKPFGILASVCLAFALAVSPTVGIVSAASTPQLFTTETAAHQHCPKDEVVWLNTRSGIYHLPGSRWYGRTKNGAYVCRKEADAAGDRASANGQ